MKKYSLKPSEAIFVLLLGLPNLLIGLTTFVAGYKKYKKYSK